MPASCSRNRTGSKWLRALSCSSTPRWPMATGSVIPGARTSFSFPASPPITPPSSGPRWRFTRRPASRPIWQAPLDRHYANADNGGYFLTADDAAGLVVRPNATTDDATPNPNALAAQNLIRLAVFTGQHAWRDKADRLFEGIAASAGENLFA